MALTQHATHPNPSWDESIVPALRQRLQGESRVLTKRMSNLSMSSVEEQPVASSSSSGHRTATRPVQATSRPGTGNGARPTTERADSTPTTTTTTNGRSRTLSQPPAFHNFHKPSNSVHSTNYDSRPTRIPKASRSPPIGTSRSPPMTLNSSAADLWEPPNHPNPSLSSIPTPSHKFSNGFLHDEQPPFQPRSFNSTEESFDPPRMSMESEERPFEHWYRGESSRNGGVGELRVGNQREMLEIAHYGHAMRNKPRKEYGGYRDALTDAIHSDSPKRRRRADSVGPRGSFYLDEKSGSGPLVFDEAPLTDVELDDEGYGDEYLDDYFDGLPSRTPTPTTEPDHTVKIPVSPPVAEPRKTSETVRTVTEAPRAEAPPPEPAPPSKPATLPVAQQPKRAVSPQNRPPPTSPGPKKGLGKSTPPMTPMRERQLAREKEREKQRAKEKALQNRRSIGQYNLEGNEGDMMHAIPSWTQPVHGGGNWDEVVLPAVAKKKGLDADGSYETADGTAKEKTPPPIEPAPGTFGFNHDRFRSSREGESPPVDEFRPYTPPSQPQEEVAPEPEPTVRKIQPPKPIQPPAPSTPIRPPAQSPPSPAPFSHYPPQRTLVMDAQDARPPRPPEPEEEPTSGGCCKCVIM